MLESYFRKRMRTADLLEKIKAEHELRMIFKPQFLTKSDHPKDLFINLKNYDLDDKYIRSFKLKVKSLSGSGDSPVENSDYAILIGNSPVYENNYPKNTEFIPDNIILLNGLMEFTEVSLIIRNVDMRNLTDYIFEVHVQHVEFANEFVELAKMSYIEQSITKNDMTNVLITNGGSGFLKFTEYRNVAEPESDKCGCGIQDALETIIHPNKDESFRYHKIEGHDVTIGDIKGFQMTNEGPHLIPLCVKPSYGFSIVTSLTIDTSMDNYHVTENKPQSLGSFPWVSQYIYGSTKETIYTHNLIINIPRPGDLLGQFIFNFKNLLDVKKLSVSLYTEEAQFDLPVLHLPVENCNYITDANIYCNLLMDFPNNKLKLKLTYHSDSLNQPFSDFTADCKYLYLQDSARRKLARSKLFQIDIPMFEQLFASAYRST